MIKINIRWSDIDANRHLANSAYINFMSYARVVYMKNAGVTQQVLEELNIGPIVFREQIYYFKEVWPDQPVYIDVVLDGFSENGAFFSFKQDMYDPSGRNVATYEMMGGWMDMEKRKIRGLPQEILERFKSFKTSKDFRILTREDTRTPQRFPKDIDADIFTKERPEND